MPAQNSATRDLCSQTDPSDGWDMVVIRRLGAPPLRFAGRAVCSGRDGDLAVRIWRARTGGFVLAHSVETPGVEAASRHARGEDVMLALETYCRDLDASGDLPVDLRAARQLQLLDLLEDMARMADRRRRFSALVGETLDAFETQVGARSLQHAGGVE